MTPLPLRLLARLDGMPPENPPAPRVANDADLILVGGGLANGLIAWRLRQLRPEIRLLVLEAGPALGGNHTWSFHEAELAPAQQAWLAPLVAHRWDGHEVALPSRRRILDGGHGAITSARFDAVLRDALAGQVRLATPVGRLSARTATLTDGRVLRAGAVIDGRGLRPSRHLNLQHQHFIGQELRLARPHGLRRPLLMDATVAQHGGCRFVQVLPLGADTVLVGDTSDAGDAGAAHFDADRLRARIADYAAGRGWTVAEVLREERGLRPVMLGGDIHAFWQESQGIARSGLAAGLFHGTTGHGLAGAVRLAERVAALPDLSSMALFEAIRAHALAQWKAQRFYRLFNRLLLRAATPHQRRRRLQRFYGLPAPLIGRFHAERLGWLDKARLLAGQPLVAGAAWRAGGSAGARHPLEGAS